jgi:ankyrin repeat protein
MIFVVKRTILTLCCIFSLILTVSSQSDSINFAFLTAVFEDDSEQAIELIKKGAEVNYTSTDNVSALHYSVVNKNQHLMLYLINTGANVNHQDNNGNTPLALAADLGYDSLMFSLIMADAEIHISNQKMEYPLHHAVLSGNPVAVDMLLFYGAKVQVKDKDSLTPLHYAAYNGMDLMSSILIAANAQVNATDKFGRTAFYYAVMKNSLPTMRVLIDAGADLWTKDNKGISFLEISLSEGNAETTDFLLETLHEGVKEKMTKPDILNRLVNNKKLWSESLRADNVKAIQLYKQYELKRPLNPVMGSLYLQMAFVGVDDFFSNWSLLWKEVNYKFSVEAGFGYRVGRRKVLVPITTNTYYQAREMRLNYFLAAYKDFIIVRFPKKDNRIELTTGLLMPFTTAGYRGMKTRDKMRFTYAPTIGLAFFQREGVKLFGMYHFWNYDELNFSKHKFSLGFAVRIKSY